VGPVSPPRAIIKAAEWTLRATTPEGAPQAIFAVMCMTCHAESEAVDDERLSVELWTLKHTGRNPAHRLFKLTTECWWEVGPEPGNPFYGAESGSRR
jgi:hypothetical protein